MSKRYFIRLSFDGSSFHGWQQQPNAVSVQALIKEALSVILKENIAVTGAGRTDTGVHAKNYFAHFNSHKPLDTKAIRDLIHHLNGYLPGDITIHSVFPVPGDAHARFSAIQRTYQYLISRTKAPFLKSFSYFYPGKLDIALMNRGAEILLKNSDFTSFTKTPTDSKNSICHLTRAVWEEHEDLLIFTVSADRFLRNMVRAMVGTLIEVGRGKITPEEIEKIIVKKDRCAAGYSVPARGLFLTEITYPEEVFTDAPEMPGNKGITGRDPGSDLKDAAKSHLIT
jgi:tRNA pseudouridine38-40 synthase